MSGHKISYSQSGEDLIIDFIFDSMQIKSRRYLDIGTNDPAQLNNTYLFYTRGHKGVCVEPDPDLVSVIEKLRPNDQVLGVGVGQKEGKLPFYQMDPHTLSTFSKKEAETYQKYYPWSRIVRTKKISVISINDILKKYFNDGLDFLSIDTEGLDSQIIKSLDFEKYQPIVICIETAVYKDKSTLTKNRNVIEYLKSKGYFVYADTFVNSIMVNYETWQRKNGSSLEGY